MTAIEKIKPVDNNIEQKTALCNLDKKQLRFQLYYLEMFLNMNL